MRTGTPLLALASAALLASPALADRAPTAAETAAIAPVLKAAGFVSWEEIELDDDGPLWEIDDARTANGQKYDVKIDPKTMKIIRKTLDR
ncbi:MAG TPA: PepSY domain-containing protein [Sphingomonadaceae bacterium]|nr:PepSY domain-containing protein [Sphingomonadaceae bacterium]